MRTILAIFIGAIGLMCLFSGNDELGCGLLFMAGLVIANK